MAADASYWEQTAGERLPAARPESVVVTVSAQLSTASLIAAGLLDSARINEVVPRQQPRRPRRSLRERWSRTR